MRQRTGSSWESVPLKSKITARIGTSRRDYAPRDAALGTPARARGGVRARALEHPARAGARSRGGDGGGARRRGGRLRPVSPCSRGGSSAQSGPTSSSRVGLQLLYFALLITAYRKADVSVVYPVARGVAPVLVLVAGVVVLGYGTSGAQAPGVVLVGLGVLAIRGCGAAPVPRASLFGLAIACVIASYTLVDKRGLDYASADHVPRALDDRACALALRGRVARHARGTVACGASSTARRSSPAIATFTAYALVLAALERASAASVAAVRETSVLIATGLAAVVLHEQSARGRLAGRCTHRRRRRAPRDLGGDQACPGTSLGHVRIASRPTSARRSPSRDSP